MVASVLRSEAALSRFADNGRYRNLDLISGQYALSSKSVRPSSQVLGELRDLTLRELLNNGVVGSYPLKAMEGSTLVAKEP